MKCTICKSAIAKTFLDKIEGTKIQHKGKEVIVCSACQKKLKTIEAIKKELDK